MYSVVDDWDMFCIVGYIAYMAIVRPASRVRPSNLIVRTLKLSLLFGMRSVSQASLYLYSIVLLYFIELTKFKCTEQKRRFKPQLFSFSFVWWKIGTNLDNQRVYWRALLEGKDKCAAAYASCSLLFLLSRKHRRITFHYLYFTFGTHLKRISERGSSHTFPYY